MILLSTDGYSNSYDTTEGFEKIGVGYLRNLQEGNGISDVAENLSVWLNETSEQGSGDDVTLAIAYRITSLKLRTVEDFKNQENSTKLEIDIPEPPISDSHEIVDQIITYKQPDTELPDGLEDTAEKDSCPINSSLGELSRESEISNESQLSDDNEKSNDSEILLPNDNNDDELDTNQFSSQQDTTLVSTDLVSFDSIPKPLSDLKSDLEAKTETIISGTELLNENSISDVSTEDKDDENKTDVKTSFFRHYWLKFLNILGSVFRRSSARRDSANLANSLMKGDKK